MSATIMEKIASAHAGRDARAGDVVDISIDARLARDFGGANVVKHIEDNGLGVDDPSRTFFTFDCNPGGSDQKYAANQQICRRFARARGIRVFDVDRGIGTHLAVDEGLVGPGGTLVSTDSHANILGAIGAFGQGMGDQDIASAWAYGKVWFEIPRSLRVVLRGAPGPHAAAKDITLACLRRFGASGLLGFAAEFHGPAVDALSLDGRITLASMATEMGGIIVFIPPDEDVIEHCRNAGARAWQPVHPDPGATYADEVEVSVEALRPLISRPGHPEDVIEAREVAGTKIDSAFIGSCTNGRFEDMLAAARVLDGRKVAPGVVLKIVPSTDRVWRRCLAEGLIETFKAAGALVGNAGCAGCAAGQIGQNGPGEVTVSTGNRNFAGKQGKGDVWLASPETAAASAVAGAIATADAIPERAFAFVPDAGLAAKRTPPVKVAARAAGRPTRVSGRVWVIARDNVDTDMIFHNRHLTVTDVGEMGQYCFGNLEGWMDFPKKVKAGDVVVVGSNFGCGSSRQQAVDCLRSLGVSLVIARSFGSIYERNAINAGLPILTADPSELGLQDGDVVEADLESGVVSAPSTGRSVKGKPFSEVQMDIYQRGGLLKSSE